jgi:hypothetical protein
VSGRGRVGGRFALEAFTEPKTVLYPAPRAPDTPVDPPRVAEST